MNLLNSLVGKVIQINQKLATPITFTFISERVFHCSYPNDAKDFKASLHNQFGGKNIQIINLSEYAYSGYTEKIFQ